MERLQNFCLSSQPGAPEMLDHVMVKVKDWKRAKAYHEATLKHLGYELFVDKETFGGFKGNGAPHGNIYISQGTSSATRPPRTLCISYHSTILEQWA